MSLQAIWLDVNWSMTDPIYSVSRWVIILCCYVVIDIHVIVLFYVIFLLLLNRMFAFVLHSEYTTSCFGQKVSYDTT